MCGAYVYTIIRECVLWTSVDILYGPLKSVMNLIVRCYTNWMTFCTMDKRIDQSRFFQSAVNMIEHGPHRLWLRSQHTHNLLSYRIIDLSMSRKSTQPHNLPLLHSHSFLFYFFIRTAWTHFTDILEKAKHDVYVWRCMYVSMQQKKHASTCNRIMAFTTNSHGN